MMSRRYTCNTGDYPEHLNPFREDNESDGFIKTKFNTVGRRKLKAVLSLTSWTGTLFPMKKTKPDDREVPVMPKLTRNKFLTMTPKISRDLLERLSQRTNRDRNSSPASNPASSRDQLYSFSDFKITPKSSRERFAMKPNVDDRNEAEASSYLWASPGRDSMSPSSPTTPISEVCGDYYDLSEETKHTKQGARPKKKRQAPLPPPVLESTAGDKQDNTTTAEMEESLALSEPTSPEPRTIEEPLVVSEPTSTGPRTIEESLALSEPTSPEPRAVEEPLVVSEPTSLEPRAVEEPLVVSEPTSLEPRAVEEPLVLSEPTSLEPRTIEEPLLSMPKYSSESNTNNSLGTPDIQGEGIPT